MKRQSLQTHLRPYSIYGKRKTTIHHAFASALAANEEYGDARVAQAIRDLGQDPDADLMCAYCDERPAETWDHVVGLVKGTKYSGFGHTLGNLVPCCKQCNSKKGNKEWQAFLATAILDPERRRAKIAHLESYLATYGHEQLTHAELASLLPNEMEELERLEASILEQMREANKLGRVLSCGRVRGGAVR